MSQPLCVVVSITRTRDGETYPYGSAVYGPFADRQAADAFARRESGSSGWDKIECEVMELQSPGEAES